MDTGTKLFFIAAVAMITTVSMSVRSLGVTTTSPVVDENAIGMRDTYISFLRASKAEDVKAIVDCFEATDDSRKSLSESWAATIVAYRHLAHAYVKQFGIAVADLPENLRYFNDEAYANLVKDAESLSAESDPSGGFGELQLGNGGTMKMVRVGTKWKISTLDLFHLQNADKDHIAKVMIGQRQEAMAIAGVADKIESGEIHSVKEANQELWQQLREIADSERPPIKLPPLTQPAVVHPPPEVVDFEPGAISAVCASGEVVAASRAGGEIELRNLRTGELLKEINLPKQAQIVRDIAMTKDANGFVAVSYLLEKKNRMALLDCGTATTAWDVAQGLPGAVYFLGFSDDDSRLFCSVFRYIAAIDTKRNGAVTDLYRFDPPGGVRNTGGSWQQMSSAGDAVACVDEEQVIAKTVGGKALWQQDGHFQPIRPFGMGTYCVVYNTADSNVRALDWQSGKDVKTWKLADGMKAVAVSPMCNAIVALADKKWYLQSPGDGKVVQLGGVDGSWEVKFSSDGREVLSIPGLEMKQTGTVGRAVLLHATRPSNKIRIYNAENGGFERELDLGGAK